MSLATNAPEADLFVPQPGGADWDPHVVHTHYFGFHIPEAAIGSYIYIRWMPRHPMAHGGVCIYRGLENNHDYLDVEHHNYQIGLPWPKVDGSTITTENGLRIEFVVPGEHIRLRYTSDDGATSFDLEQRGVTKYYSRGHMVPGEDLDSATDPTLLSGGGEQLMHCTGEVVLNGERFDVDCYPYRDRSWCQVRREIRESGYPPVALTPIYFGPDFAVNQVGFEPLDTSPAWKGVYDVDADMPTHHVGWLESNGETFGLKEVRRNVLTRHPELHVATSQEVEITDERGKVHRFTGEAIAAANIPNWPNAAYRDCVYRWQDEQGRVAHSMYCEFWTQRYQRAMRQHRA